MSNYSYQFGTGSPRRFSPLQSSPSLNDLSPALGSYERRHSLANTPTPKRSISGVIRRLSLSITSLDSAGSPGPRGRLTLEALLRMTPVINGVDVVQELAQEAFIGSMRSDAAVEKVFFGNYVPQKYDQISRKVAERSHFDLGAFASLLIAQAIFQGQDPFGFWEMIDGARVEERLHGLFEGLIWKKIGFDLYTALFIETVRDDQTDVGLRDYVVSCKQERMHWAELLSEHVMQSRWVYETMSGIVRGQLTEADYNRDLNVIFLKLHLLYPRYVMVTFQYLLKALPNLRLDLATRNYLGSFLHPELFVIETQKTIFQVKEVRESSLPKRSGSSEIIPNGFSKSGHDDDHNDSSHRKSENRIFLVYGDAVSNFILTQVDSMGYWTGKLPQNVKPKPKRTCIIL